MSAERLFVNVRDGQINSANNLIVNIFGFHFEAFVT